MFSPDDRSQYLRDCRALALAEIDRVVPNDGPFASVLYDLMRDYPLREAKALRPALCIATTRALGGDLSAALPSAAAVELYHNAFLVHDDVEDGSTTRRDRPTLHTTHGVPIAVNVGDAMLAVTLRPLLDNLRVLGLGPALRILDVVARMSMESAEGQALELDWIQKDTWHLSEDDYLLMVHKKTTWYSFITPIELGAIAAGASDSVRSGLRLYADRLGAAFQIRDDVLNLIGSEDKVGKERAGDLWEGKRTLMLLHALSKASPADRERAVGVLTKPRPERLSAGSEAARTVLEDLHRSGDVPHAAYVRLATALGPGLGQSKTPEDIEFLLDLLDRHGSIAHASRIANHLAAEAEAAIRSPELGIPPSVHQEFLISLVEFVVDRDR